MTWPWWKGNNLTPLAWGEDGGNDARGSTPEPGALPPCLVRFLCSRAHSVSRRAQTSDPEAWLECQLFTHTSYVTKLCLMNLPASENQDTPEPGQMI